MTQKTIIKAEIGTLIVTLMRDKNGEPVLCREPVIAWCVTIDDDGDIEFIPLTVDGNSDEMYDYAIQYPPSGKNSFEYRIPGVVSFDFGSDSDLLAELIESERIRIENIDQKLAKNILTSPYR